MSRLLAVALLVVGCKSDDKPAPPAPARAALRAPEAVPERPLDPYFQDRADMVARTIEGRGISDPRVLTAMRLTPRHELVPPAIRNEAYEDRPLPIGFGLTISQPYIVAAMTEAARVKPGDRVLEIGTGSGYQAVVLALMGAKVHTVEIHEDLGRRTTQVLKRLGLGNIELKIGDGWYGWPDAGPFDAIIVTCATPVIPDRLLAQLKLGGRMVLPLSTDHMQAIEIVEKTADGHNREVLMDGVRFGPMLGVVEAEW